MGIRVEVSHPHCRVQVPPMLEIVCGSKTLDSYTVSQEVGRFRGKGEPEEYIPTVEAHSRHHQKTKTEVTVGPSKGLKTRKSSCLNVRGIPPAEYSLCCSVVSWAGRYLPWWEWLYLPWPGCHGRYPLVSCKVGTPHQLETRHPPVSWNGGTPPPSPLAGR